MTDKEFLEHINKEPKTLLPKEIRQCLEAADVFWVYDGEPRADYPHVGLTSGKHSNGFINVGSALKSYSGFRYAAALSLITNLGCGLWIEGFTHVVGADTSSTELAALVARIIGVKHIRMTKHQDEKGKRQLWHPSNEPLLKGDKILHIEELITTSSSALQVREGIRRSNPDTQICFAEYLPTVVNRSDPENPVTKVENSKVISLLRIPISNFDPDKCPHCEAGSKAIKPKEGNNWSKLTGK